MSTRLVTIPTFHSAIGPATSKHMSLSDRCRTYFGALLSCLPAGQICLQKTFLCRDLSGNRRNALTDLLNSPSVIVLSPRSLRKETAYLTAASSAGFRSSSEHLPSSSCARLSQRYGGLMRDPTCSARKGGLRCSLFMGEISRKHVNQPVQFM